MMFLVTLYMSFNLWTDVRHLRTKNYWHFSFFTIAIVIAYREHVLLMTIISCAIGFLLGWLLQKVLKHYGNGDIKMLMVLSMYLFLITHNPLFFISPYFTTYVLISIAHILALKYVQTQTMCNIKLGGYRISSKKITVPEAVPLAIGLLITLYI